MSEYSSIVIIGGFPEPIGGVTGFVSSVASKNLVEEVIDIYPSIRKNEPPFFNGRVVYLSGLFSFCLYYFSNFLSWKGHLLHFNFSREKSVILFLILPKFFAKFALMLHHGKLKSNTILSFIYRICLKRIDHVFCLSEEQKKFYLEMGVPFKRIISTSSYVDPYFDPRGITRKGEINLFFEGAKVLVASGYPTVIYNHSWCIDYVIGRADIKLAIFLYGIGDMYEFILGKVCGKIKVFEDCGRDDFNYALSKAAVYLRPTKTDSFGVAVADALEQGTPVVASDVCKRYPGTILFSAGDYSDFCQTVNTILDGKPARRKSPAGFSKFTYQSLK